MEKSNAGTKAAMLTAAAVCALSAALPAFAEDWPQWRGPTGMGLSAEKDLPVSWGGQDNTNILWKVELPRAYHPFSSPIVSAGRVFLTTATDEHGSERLLCYRARDGRKLWDTFVKPGEWKMDDRRGSYCYPTPAADGKCVFAAFGSGVIACIDYDGKAVWRAPLGSCRFDVALGSSPVLHGDLVILLNDQLDGGSRLTAFDRKTGAVRWRRLRPTFRRAHSTPILISVNGRCQMVVSAADALQGIDPATGETLWWCKSVGETSSPVYAAGMVYCDSGRWLQGVEYRSAVLVSPTGSGDVTETHVTWRIERIFQDLASPVVVAGRLYRLGPSGRLTCLDLKARRQVYQQRLRGAITWTSPVATADGLIYFASAGKSYVVKAGAEFEIVGESDLDDRNGASPAVADGRIFLRGRKRLYCIGRPTAESQPRTGTDKPAPK
jgi:outer membrane protein assembly factor BamB